MIARLRMRRSAGPLCALVGCALALLVLGAGRASGSAPDALVVLPPGEGNTVTLSAFAANQAMTDCGGLGPHVCDQRDLYRDWGFRRAPLSASAAQVADVESDQSPAPGVRVVRDRA